MNPQAATLRLASVVHDEQTTMAIDHNGQLLGVEQLEQLLQLETSLTRFSDSATNFTRRVFSLGMAGLSELIDSLGVMTPPASVVLEPDTVVFLPPTTKHPAWAEFHVFADDPVPRFHWKNSASLRGHDAPIMLASDEPRPRVSAQIAAIVAEELHRASVTQAARGIAGVTLLTCWDLPTRERVIPAWGTCYVGQLGPYLVHQTSYDPRDWTMHLRVNKRTVMSVSGRPWNTGFAEMIALASEASPLLPGDIISTGPIAQISGIDRRSLQPGDVIEVEVEPLGTLRGTIVMSNDQSRFLGQLEIHAESSRNQIDTEPPTSR